MQKPTFGIAVDGSCLGNPGPGEYRAVDLVDGKEFFRFKFKKTTNNVMEFFALVHALKFRKEHNANHEIYSDSQTAIAWVREGKCNTDLVKDEDSKNCWDYIHKYELWLVNNRPKGELPISKWRTDLWGENPADFGYKFKKVVSQTSNGTNLEKIEKSEIKKFIEEEYKNQIMPDITTLARLAKRFNIEIDLK